MKRNGKQPVVSVIVPTYNAGEFVAQCLDSVLGQTMGDFELICVDDGSTDDTWAIVEERAQRDGRVAALRQANAGPGAARNAGLERACGRYVYCLDADDYLECDMLASCVKALDDAQACLLYTSQLQSRKGRNVAKRIVNRKPHSHFERKRSFSRRTSHLSDPWASWKPHFCS